MPCPDSMYQGDAGVRPSAFQSASSRACVPDLSPRETNRAPAAAMRRNAPAAFFAPRRPAGSASGPSTTKSLYMTRRRLSSLPLATYVFSSAGAWASVTSASPRAASARAWPVPTAIVLTVNPVCFSNIGTSTSRSPESWVEVVVERMTTGDCAAAGADATSRRPRASRSRSGIGVPP